MIYAYFILIIFFVAITWIEKQNNNIPKKRKQKNPKFCILIPARDESKVIEGLLKSIQEQTYPIDMKDVYVIVEDKKDKTVKICEKYQTSVFVRKHIELQRKGYALDECIQEIWPKNYDAYFIFDADNILDKDYLKEMLKTFEEGYDIGAGYRNIKNKENILSVASFLTFSILNGLGNESKNKDTRNITLSGTGFYIHGKWIKKWKGYPFHELTEDYELTLYSILHNMTSYYNKDAIFYDEQPTSLSTSITQRKRWIRGYFESRKKYIPQIRKTLEKSGTNNGSRYGEILGIIPIVLVIVAFLIPLFRDILILNQGLPISRVLIILGTRLFLLYFIASVLTYLLIEKENKKLKLNTAIKIKASLYHPFFLMTYLPAALLAVTAKEIKWDKIEHKEELTK